MTKDLELQSALAALDEYGYEKKVSTDLEKARNKLQMKKYIQTLDYSLRRLLVLQEAITETVEEQKQQLAQQEVIQTYKTKIINLSREFNISYNDVLQVMAQSEHQTG